jgi:hypothetical protein
VEKVDQWAKKEVLLKAKTQTDMLQSLVDGIHLWRHSLPLPLCELPFAVN